MKIQLNLISEIKDFTQIASKVPEEVALRSGNYVVDAKSLLGILSLDLAKPIELEVSDQYLELFKQFEF